MALMNRIPSELRAEALERVAAGESRAHVARAIARWCHEAAVRAHRNRDSKEDE